MAGSSTNACNSSAATVSCANMRFAVCYADARVLRIYGGTSEIMRELISRNL